MPRTVSLNTIIYASTACIILIVAYEQLVPPVVPTLTPLPPGQEKECLGEPIYVKYPYAGGMLDPWECKIQCTDKKQRYIVYTNGKATPCDALPGCLDWGEDYGVLCKAPGMSTGSGSQKAGAKSAAGN